MNKPPKPQAVDEHSSEHCFILERLTGEDPMIIGGPGINVRVTSDGKYVITAKLVAQTSASFKLFKVVSDGGDVYNCTDLTWDGASPVSSTTPVAKTESKRCILPGAGGGAWASRTERADICTFTYAAVSLGTYDGVNVSEYSRTKTISGVSETAWIEDPLLPGDTITAIPMTFPNGPSTLSGVQWQAIDDGRAWATDDVD